MLHQHSYLLLIQIYAEVSQTCLQLLSVQLPISVIIHGLEHLGETSDGQGASHSEGRSDILNQGCAIIRQLLWGGNWLSGGWILGSKDLPDILVSGDFHRQVDDSFSNHFIGKLLVLELDSGLLARNLILHAELVSIFDEVTRKEFLGGSMLNDQLRVGLDWSANEG